MGSAGRGLAERTGLMRASFGMSLLLVLLGSASAQAQLWTGPAALEVRAEDGGKPAAGGEVRLEFLDLEPSDGPEPVPLDSRGRAVIGGLAEGHWRLEVSRPGAMTYRAEILVRAGGKPQLINAVQHNVPGAVSMMEVRLARARGGETPPARPSAPRPSPPPIPPAPEPEPEPVAPAPEPKPEPLPAPPPPAPAPEPEPAPAAQPQPAPAPAAQPQPTPPPPPPRLPEPEREMPRPAQPPSRPAPPPARPAPAPAPGAKPGESSLSAEAVVPPGGGGCGEGVREVLMRREVAGLPAGCQALRVELPPNARYLGYRFEVQDTAGGGSAASCEAGKDCPSGDARWPMMPLMIRDGTGKTLVSAAFENRSADRERRAVLTVFYKEAGNPGAPQPLFRTRPRDPGSPPPPLPR